MMRDLRYSGRRISAIVMVLFFAMTAMVTLTWPVSADMGPKPSVTVQVKGMSKDEICYATLLGETGTGPASPYEGDDPQADAPETNGDIWLKFVMFEDVDGYRYLQQDWMIQYGQDSFTWGYYPPSPFKILLYFPAYNSFVVSNIGERYAFDSSYSIDITGSGYQTPDSTVTLSLVEESDTAGTLAGVAIRLVLTIAIEIGIALAFGYREKNLLIFIGGVNVLTQVLLALALVVTEREGGVFLSILFYILMETAIFFFEGILYFAFLKPISKKPIQRGWTILYTFLANTASCLVGLLLVLVQT